MLRSARSLAGVMALSHPDSAHRPVRAAACAPRRAGARRPRARPPAAVLERRRREEGDHRLRRAGDEGRVARLRPAGRAHRRVRQRRHALVRAADVLPGRCSPSTASRRWPPKHPEWKDKQPFKAVLDGDRQGAARRRREGRSSRSWSATHTGMTTDEFDAIVQDWIEDRAAPEVQAAVHRVRLPADARSARVPAGERVQDVHRLRRRRRVHARRGRRRCTASRRSRSSAAAVKHEVRGARRRSRCSSSEPTDRLRRRQAGQAGRHQQLIGRRPVMAFGNSDGDFEMLAVHDGRQGAALRPDRPPHRRRARVRLRPQVAHRQARQGASTRPRKRGWIVVDMKKDWKTIFPPEVSKPLTIATHRCLLNEGDASCVSDGESADPGWRSASAGGP